jgi:hypothetical protein
MFPRPMARLVGLSLHLCRVTLGLTQQEAGELIGIPPKTAMQTFREYEQGQRRPGPQRWPAIIALLERACLYTTGHFGTVAQSRTSVPHVNDPDYALKLFKYWQMHDGTKSGLRRLIPYLVVRPAPRRVAPLPGERPVGPPVTYTVDEVEPQMTTAMYQHARGLEPPPRARARA